MPPLLDNFTRLDLINFSNYHAANKLMRSLDLLRGICGRRVHLLFVSHTSASTPLFCAVFSKDL